MNHHMLRPGNGLILLFLVFVCVPTFVRTKDSKPAPKAPSRGNTGGACTEGVANLVGNTVSGTIRFLKQGAGGTRVQIEVKGLKRGESSNFHIHEKPAGADGKNCAAAGEHFGANGKPICTGRAPDQSKCQIGDLSGKSEPISVRGNGQATVSYVDQVIDISKIVGLGVVIHEGKTTKRIACGNIFCKKK